MRRVLVAASAAVIGLALVPAAGEAGQTASQRTSYELYCASCHGPEGRGAESSLRPMENAPPLSRLGEKYGMPLPRARLASFILLDTRTGGGHLCGDHLLPSVPGLQSSGLLERVIVSEALSYLESVQRSSASASASAR